MRLRTRGLIISAVVICTMLLTLEVLYLINQPKEVQPIIILTTPDSFKSENLNDMYDRAITDWRRYMPKRE